MEDYLFSQEYQASLTDVHADTALMKRLASVVRYFRPINDLDSVEALSCLVKAIAHYQASEKSTDHANSHLNYTYEYRWIAFDCLKCPSRQYQLFEEMLENKSRIPLDRPNL